MSLEMFHGADGVSLLFLGLFVVASALVIALQMGTVQFVLKRQEWQEADEAAEKIRQQHVDAAFELERQRRLQMDAAFRAGWRF